jgi:phage gp46-like protein
VKLNLYWSYKPDAVTMIARQYTKDSIESILKSSLLASVKAHAGKVHDLRLGEEPDEAVGRGLQRASDDNGEVSNTDHIS